MDDSESNFIKPVYTDPYNMEKTLISLSIYNKRIVKYKKENFTDGKLYNYLENIDEAKFKLFNSFDRIEDVINKLNEHEVKYWISGSVCLYSVYQAQFIPNDIDIYMLEDDPKYIRIIDYIIHQVYHDCRIHIIRSPYLLNWWIEDNPTAPHIQLILPVGIHPELIFMTYHSDAVCVGFNGKDFYYMLERFDKFIKTGINRFTTKLVQPKFLYKIIDAYNKYQGRFIKCEIDIDKHQAHEYKNYKSHDTCEEFYHEYPYELNYDVFKAIYEKIKYITISDNIQDVYHGELFKPLIECMTKYTKCLVCNKYNLDYKICPKCEKMEEDKLRQTISIIQHYPINMNILITGGRCGLGYAITNLLKNGLHIKPYITTRYTHLSEHNDTIYLNLKDSSTWKTSCDMIENGTFDIIILSASETLHYNDDIELKEATKASTFDFTHDIVRKNTGVWHKTLANHSDDEIIDPLLINVAGNSALLRSFVKCCKKDMRPRLAIVITSFEGSFEKKSSFHPLTNASKSALEQIVNTIKREIHFLGSNIVLVDPGWMYTESINGKEKGTIEIDWGARQVLEPISLYMTNFNICLPDKFKRQI